MKILMLGDIYGGIGRKLIETKLPQIMIEHGVDFVIANGENATHGKSISYEHYLQLKNAKIDVITSGNHIFKRDDVLDYIGNHNDLLKPLNLNPYLPGAGTVVKLVKNKKIRVTCLMGRVFMDSVDNPYYAFDQVLKNDDSDLHFVDFHAEASAEKAAFAWNYDGQITALVGTHTHVQTADERILPKQTAFITDLGMCGPINSIIGADPIPIIQKEKFGLLRRFNPASGPGWLSGVIITTDDASNKAVAIERILSKE